MSFFMGLAEGIATGASRTIGTILDKREEEASAARKYMQQRNIQKSEQYESEKVEMEGLMKGFAEITGNDLDKAAQLIKGAGTIERANARLEMLTAERLKNENFDVNGLYTFAQRETNTDNPYTIGEYIENLVSRPTLATMPESKKFGLGLADKFLPKAQEIALPERTGREFDIGTAAMMPGKTTVAQEYKRETDIADIQLQQAQATLNKTLLENSQAGSIDSTQVNRDFSSVVKANLDAADIPSEISEGRVQFSLDTVAEKAEGIADAYQNGLTNIVEEAVKTNSLNVPGMKSTLKTAALSAAGFMQKADKIKPAKISDMEQGGIYSYGGTPDNPEASILWLQPVSEGEPVEGVNYIIIDKY